MTQPTEFLNAGGFYPEVLTQSLDRLTILVQQLAASTAGLYLVDPSTLTYYFFDQATSTWLGPFGEQGETGPAPIINPGTVTTLSPGSSATVTLTGTNPYSFDFGIPSGQPAVMLLGGVTTLSPGSSATVTLTGSNPYTLSFGIPSGITGAPGVSSLAQLAGLRIKQSMLPNLFNPATVTAGSFINGTTGALVANSGFSYSDYIPANTGGTMITSAQIANGTFGYAFYDQGLTFISGSNTSVGAGGTITVPSTAAFVRISLQNSAVITEMLCNGSTLPSAYVSFFPASQQNVLTVASQLVNTLIGNKLTGGMNLVDYTQRSVGALTASTGVVDPTQTSEFVSNYLFVWGAGTIICSAGMAGFSTYGYTFYDQNFSVLSFSTSPVSANTPLTVPQNAAYFRFTWTFSANGIGSGIYVVEGSTLPGAYVPYVYTPPLSSASIAAIENFLNLTLPTVRSLLNPATSLANTAIQQSNGAAVTLSGQAASAFMPVAPGGTYAIGFASVAANVNYGLGWYDLNQNYISGVPYPFTAGQVVTAPVNAAFARITYQGGSTAQMFMVGGTAPAYYVPYNIAAETNTSPAKGKNIGFWGDSITQLYGTLWQPALLARTGIVNAFSDSHAGRTFGAIWEDYGGSSTGTNLGPSAPGTNTGTAGNTVAQDIANLDGMICFMGTNPDATLGSPGDPPTAATTYGYIANFIQGILTAKPTLRLVMITPYNGQLRNTSMIPVAAAIASVASLYGVPVLNLYANGGFNQFNWATELQVDGLHPSATGGVLIGNAVGEFLKQWF